MSAIAHAVVEQTTKQTTTSTSMVDVTGASLASGNFTAGDKYLILVTAQLAIQTSASFLPSVQTVHGTTAFAESVSTYKTAAVDTYFSYSYATIWTAVASEGIKLQFQTSSATRAAEIDQITIDAIHVTELAASDVQYALNSSALSLTTTPQDGASVTFTPANNNDDWLVMTGARFVVATTSIDDETQMSESVGATTTPLWRGRTNSASSIPVAHCFRTFALSNASHTIKEQAFLSAAGAAGDQRTHSWVLCLRLNAFNQHAVIYTDGATGALSGTAYATNVQTVNFTPNPAGDWCVLSSWMYKPGGLTNFGKGRQQIAAADDPATQTTDSYAQNQALGSSDTRPISYSTISNQTASAKTVNADGSCQTSGTPVGQQRVIASFSMELPAAGNNATDSDSAVDAESASIAAQTTTTEADVEAEGQTINANTTSAESAVLAEQASASLTQPVSASDSGVDTEAVSALSASTTSPEAAVQAESSTLTATTSSSDVHVQVDAQSTTASVSTSDAQAQAETLASNAVVSDSDSAVLAESATASQQSGGALVATDTEVIVAGESAVAQLFGPAATQPTGVSFLVWPPYKDKKTRSQPANVTLPAIAELQKAIPTDVILGRIEDEENEEIMALAKVWLEGEY